MTKYHIGANGPGVCKAKYKCRFGGESGEENHFNTQKEALAAWAEKEGLDEIPKNNLRKNSKKRSENMVNRRNRQTSYVDFKHKVVDNIAKEYDRSDLPSGEYEENYIETLARLEEEFKEISNKNQLKQYIGKMNEEKKIF